MSICLSCGEECDGNYCSQCGSRRSDVIRAVKNFPDDCRSIVERLSATVTDAIEHNDDNTLVFKKHNIIKATGDVMITGEEEDVNNSWIYSTGSVMFAPTKNRYRISLSFEDREICSAVLYSAAVIRREWSDENKCISIYTDYGKYEVNSYSVPEAMMKFVSRKPIAIVRYKDKFYVYTDNTIPKYLNICGHTWPNTEIKEIFLEQEIGISSEFKIIIH